MGAATGGRAGLNRRPGTPSLLRELNDRAALELLLTEGPMTRAQLGTRTGLSKVTASQLLSRLEDRGLVEVAGEQAGGRGPNAALYAVVPSSAYVAGLHVEQDVVSACVADVTGRVVSEIAVDPNGSGDPVELVRGAVGTACSAAGISPEALRAFVIGTPGVLDPRTGDLRLVVNLPAWHEGVHEALSADLGRPVTIENDVNLAAMAERAVGAAQGVEDFVLVWIGVGLGLATVLGGRLHRGVGGAAGEIGYLPVPGAKLPTDLDHPATGAFQSLVGAQAVLPLAAQYGFVASTAGGAVRAAVQAAIDQAAIDQAPIDTGGDGSPAVEAVIEASSGGPGGPDEVVGNQIDGASAGIESARGVVAGDGSAGNEPAGKGSAGKGSAGLTPAGDEVPGGDSADRAPLAGVRIRKMTAGVPAAGFGPVGSGRGAEFLDELASRVATGVAAISVVLDPGLVVLGGEVGLAGGEALASRVAVEVGRICPARPRVVPTGISGGPVLRGAILAAVDRARAELLASVAS
ncbi:MAG TPA: ROK family transcriptional regulator, partial [Streptosporangiaceae bacterium]|nr:ROK family transcriptional regulator [Streptosporangiaceae bacterium]